MRDIWALRRIRTARTLTVHLASTVILTTATLADLDELFCSRNNMADMSPALMWHCVRNRNCFLVKRNGIQLTSEPGNVMNKNSFQYSGIANDKSIDISIDEADEDPKMIKLSMKLKAPKRKNQPKNNVSTTPLNKNFRRVAHAISSQTAGQWYRADLTDMALARWSALHRLAMVKKGLKLKAKTKTGRHKASN